MFDNMRHLWHFFTVWTNPPSPDTPHPEPMNDHASPDAPSAVLPSSYGGLQTLQAEFLHYQKAAFPERPPRFFALELAGETGELANLEKKVWKGRQVADADFDDEAADVCIALMNFANSRGIDLARVVKQKMRHIDGRRLAEPESSGPQEDI